MKIIENFVFFYTAKDFFSNFSENDFSNEDGNWESSEKYFMYLKARFFKDGEAMENIKNTKNPFQAKKLGRIIKDFDQNLWINEREKLMFKAVYDKFSNNQRLKDFILQERFENKTFAEASPYDTIWGIGLDIKDPDITNKDKWKGRNTLGNIIGKVREQIKKDNNG